MVAKVRAGASMRAVARLHRVSLSTVQWWARRAGDLALDKVDWGNRSPIPARNARTAAAVEDLVLMLRRELKERSALGEYGAREPGFQAAIENFNGRWQAKVWSRFHHNSLAGLQAQSRCYIRAYRQRAAARIDDAPKRRSFPSPWQPNLQAHPWGVVIFIRRTCQAGAVSLLGHTFEVDPLWPHRLVRCEIDLSNHTIRFHALRRRDPNHQPLLRRTPYAFPRRPFHE
jgi:hypothetical protein